MSNPYCEQLDIDVPDLGTVSHQADANNYSLLITALLERGGPMTLAEVATRFASAGIAAADRALMSLRRCQPGRAPVYRDGDCYGLDIHHDELGLWVFRLGMRRPRVPALKLLRSIEPVPDNEQPLTSGELDEAFGRASLHSWSDQRLALAVLDAADEPLLPTDIVEAIGSRTQWHGLGTDAQRALHNASPLGITSDGRWFIRVRSVLPAVRQAVRKRIVKARELALSLPDPDVVQSYEAQRTARREAKDAELAALRTAIVTAFPAKEPACICILDPRGRDIVTYFKDDFEAACSHLDGFDLVAGEGIHTTVRKFGMDQARCRLTEIGPSQKSMRLERSRRTLKITNTLLARGSCGISRPFGDPRRMANYLANGDTGKLELRLEADAKSLFALYQFGLLHHCVRLTWGFLDEALAAPWAHRDSTSLHTLMGSAQETRRHLEVVVGSAPGWESPWGRAQVCRVHPSFHGYGHRLVDDNGREIDVLTVQLARLALGLPGKPKP